MTDQVQALATRTGDVVYAAVGSDGVLATTEVILASLGDNLLNDKGPLETAVFFAKLQTTIDKLGKEVTARFSQNDLVAAYKLIDGEIE